MFFSVVPLHAMQEEQIVVGRLLRPVIVIPVRPAVFRPRLAFHTSSNMSMRVSRLLRGDQRVVAERYTTRNRQHGADF